MLLQDFGTHINNPISSVWPQTLLGERPGMFLGAGQVRAFTNSHSLLWWQLWASHTWDEDQGRFMWEASLILPRHENSHLLQAEKPETAHNSYLSFRNRWNIAPENEVRSELSLSSFRINSYLSIARPYRAESIHSDKLLRLLKISCSQTKHYQGCSCYKYSILLWLFILNWDFFLFQTLTV